MTETLGSLLAEAAATLTQAGFAEPRRRARRLVASALDLTPAELLAHPEQVLGEQPTDHVRFVLSRIVDREPLSRILGRREFWGLEFGLSPDTLDPRPETETVVEAVLRRFPDRKAPFGFLDLGTGTGCILLALLSEFPAAIGFRHRHCCGRVNDCPPQCRSTRPCWALPFSGRRLGNSGLRQVRRDRFEPALYCASTLADLPREVALYDPCLAIDGGPDGLSAYRSVVVDVPRLLKPGGVFACEVGSGQAPAVEAILRTSGLAIDGCEPDLAGIARCVVARAVG